MLFSAVPPGLSDLEREPAVETAGYYRLRRWRWKRQIDKPRNMRTARNKKAKRLTSFAPTDFRVVRVFRGSNSENKKAPRKKSQGAFFDSGGTACLVAPKQNVGGRHPKFIFSQMRDRRCTKRFSLCGGRGL
jgi:hypothetical protein